MIDKYGYWLAGETKFLKKFDALVYASKNKLPVRFYYHDDLWKNFDRSLLGKQSLSVLYKERAQQLRDQYDYLILYYSGGADSHNVLRTFVDNDIKLDEVCVKWPKPLMDGKFYTANSQDTSAKNYWSEWDYCVKPTLKWLQHSHPEIKITIKDYVESFDRLNIESYFERSNLVRGGGLLMNNVTSESEIPLTNQGKLVGHIYGIDKPCLLTHKNKIYMFFTDLALDQVGRSNIDYYSSECFYWTPDFPILAMEQAYQLSLRYIADKSIRKYLWNGSKTQDRPSLNQFQNDLARSVLYDNWDHRFQSGKPVQNNRTDKFFWLFENSELTNLRNKYYDNLKQRTQMIDDSLLLGASSDIPVYKIIVSNFFCINEFSN